MPAYYFATARAFLETPTQEVLGWLVQAHSDAGFGEIVAEQIDAWRGQIEVLRSALSLHDHDWFLLLEFPIPRRQRRIDAVILLRDAILVLEFKSGGSPEMIAAARQVEDYALDLSDFHEPSHDRVVIPIVVGKGRIPSGRSYSRERVRPVVSVSPNELGPLLRDLSEADATFITSPIDPAAWNKGQYRPVPTIIEAASALYAGMSVREITHNQAGVQNLAATTDRILRVVKRAHDFNEKAICFVTGIPGAGKTLAGLNAVHDPTVRGNGRPASVFMSGNGPLVDILREALAADCAERTGKTKHTARREVRTFIQNVHHFVDDNLEKQPSTPPYEHAIIFDEAQRAWSAEQNQRKYRKRSPRWHMAEPEMVLEIMDRHIDWAVIVALVGGGQEIHRGEAGLAEWGKVLLGRFPHWRVIASPEAISGGEAVAGSVLFGGSVTKQSIEIETCLHLAVCVRAHRAQAMATWVNRVLDGKPEEAHAIADTFDRFPIVLTRDLECARRWLRENTRGLRRCGLVGSSGAARLRAYGLETSKAIRDAYSYPHWFLARQADVRSSYRLETLATEFEIQGLELDYVAVCWGGDFLRRRNEQCWNCLEFKGTRWNQVHNPSRTEFIRNKYRVLLTRAREGILLWVPKGDPDDSTTSEAGMNETVDYLAECGAKIL